MVIASLLDVVFVAYRFREERNCEHAGAEHIQRQRMSQRIFVPPQLHRPKQIAQRGKHYLACSRPSCSGETEMPSIELTTYPLEPKLRHRSSVIARHMTTIHIRISRKKRPSENAPARSRYAKRVLTKPSSRRAREWHGTILKSLVMMVEDGGRWDLVGGHTSRNGNAMLLTTCLTSPDQSDPVQTSGPAPAAEREAPAAAAAAPSGSVSPTELLAVAPGSISSIGLKGYVRAHK